MTTFSVKERKRATERQPDKEAVALALRFAKAIDKELGDFCKAVVLFGSCTTDHASVKSDIDVLVVVDDVARIVTPEITEDYRLRVQRAQLKTSPRLHINTLKLSNFWEYCREGDPVVINMLRDGVILVDKGFFGPVQLLLDTGRIRPTREAIWTYYGRTTTSLKSARQQLLGAVTDLYWAAIDASHAALMSVGEMPPSPEHVADMLEQHLVKQKMLEPHYPALMRELYHLQKAIAHREVKEISGEQFDAYYRETVKLVAALSTVVEREPFTR